MQYVLPACTRYQRSAYGQRSWFTTTNTGHDSIFVVVDRLSKMVHLEAITKTISEEGMAAVYADRVFRYHGVPQSIVSDRDTRFTSLFWKELAQRLGTQLRMSTAYHPQGWANRTGERGP